MPIHAHVPARFRVQVARLKEEVKKLTPPPKPKPKPKPKGLLDLDLDESEGAPPISEQLKNALRQNSTRVLDLFRSWDADGDGQVSRAEFHKAMPALGLDAPKETIDALFSEWDKDGGGEIGYAELRKILQSASRAPGPPAKAPSPATPSKLGAAAATAKALSKFKK